VIRERAGAGPISGERKLYCFGFHPWKSGYVRRYLASEGRALFVRSALEARLRGFDERSRIVVWGSGEAPDVRELAARFDVPMWRMEDGFLRSVGLGAERYTPASLVLDRRGIYYDPHAPSDLEILLRDGVYPQADLERAQRLREQIVDLALSKYNVGDRTRGLPRVPGGRVAVLVPGQVQDDASIRLGCVDVRTNLDLLRAVRESKPDAYIIFKPHPDVVSGNRKGAVSTADAASYADVVIDDAPLPACLGLAQEVHTLTSLVGFEALLRGLSVSTYGLPFYAGWGLTHDRHVHPRRSRRLSLDELICGTLIRYPMYLDPATLNPSTPEEITANLAQAMRNEPNRPIRISWSARQVRKAKNALHAMFGRNGR
jgi:capsular polysaccharide export protein